MGKIEKIKELGKKLPRGAKKKISIKSGLSNPLVVQFFAGIHTPKPETTKRLLNATNEVLEEYRKQESEIDVMIDSINI